MISSLSTLRSVELLKYLTMFHVTNDKRVMFRCQSTRCSFGDEGRGRFTCLHEAADSIASSAMHPGAYPLRFRSRVLPSANYSRHVQIIATFWHSKSIAVASIVDWIECRHEAFSVTQ